MSPPISVITIFEFDTIYLLYRMMYWMYFNTNRQHRMNQIKECFRMFFILFSILRQLLWQRLQRQVFSLDGPLKYGQAGWVWSVHSCFCGFVTELQLGHQRKFKDLKPLEHTFDCFDLLSYWIANIHHLHCFHTPPSETDVTESPL